MSDSSILTAIIHGIGPPRPTGSVEVDSLRSAHFTGRLDTLRWIIFQNLLESQKGKPPLEGGDIEIMFPLDQSPFTSRLFLEVHTNFDSNPSGNCADVGMATGEITKALSVFFPKHPIHAIMHYRDLGSIEKMVTVTREIVPRQREYTLGPNCALTLCRPKKPTIVLHEYTICLECGHRAPV